MKDKELPERLALFLSKEVKVLTGRFIHGVLGFPATFKLGVVFTRKGLEGQADYAERVTGIAPSQYMPIARLKGESSNYLAVDVSQAALPVMFFDYEAGFRLYAPSLDAFVSHGLLTKEQPTPLQALMVIYKKASALDDKGKPKEALALLTPWLDKLPQQPPKTFDAYMALPGAVMNLVGLCHKALDDEEAAISDFTRAMALESDQAGLNILALQTKHGDWASVVAFGETLRERVIESLSRDAWFWVRAYLGQAYVRLNRRDDAVSAYHEVAETFADDATRLGEARKGLEAIGTNALAEEILAWLTPAAHPVRDAAALRKFWASVPKTARDALLKSVAHKGAVTDDVLQRIVDREVLTFHDLELGDATFLSAFTRVRTLNLKYSRIKDLTPLSTLLTIQDLDLEKAHVTDLVADKMCLRNGAPAPKRNTMPSAKVLRDVWERRFQLGRGWGEALTAYFKKMVSDTDVMNPSAAQLGELFGEDFVWFDGYGIDDAAPVAHFVALAQLHLCNNALTSLDGIGDLALMRNININDNQIVSLQPLKTAVRLEEIYGGNNRLTSLSGLEHSRGLVRVAFDDNALTDVSALRNAAFLRYLSLSRNKIADLRPLGTLKRLEHLRIFSNACTDLAPLAACERLQVLECFANTGLKNILALKDLRDLRRVYSRGSLSKAEIRAFAQQRTDVVID
jgi:Leucine-rich repeat (LRR) protein